MPFEPKATTPSAAATASGRAPPTASRRGRGRTVQQVRMSTTSDPGPPRALGEWRRRRNRDRRRTPPGAPRGGLEVLSASMRAPRIPSQRGGTRLVAMMCASSPDPYAHRLAGTVHTHAVIAARVPNGRLALATAVTSEPGLVAHREATTGAPQSAPADEIGPGGRQSLTFPATGADGGVLNA